MSGSEEILLGREGGLATLVINRPKALNTLTLDNYRRFTPALRAWAADPSVHAVVVRGAGERAFCAGGDVRAVYEAGRGIKGDPDLPAVFFREEYELIRLIHHLLKPYIAVIDGITMGGGAGISVNGAYRVATERTLFAMPETAIGLFPRCRGDAVSEPLPRAHRPLSRLDRGPARGGRHPLLRLCHSLRAP